MVPNAPRNPKNTKLKTQNCQSSFCNRPPRESPPFCLLLSFSSGSKPEHCCTIAMVLHTVLLLTNLGSEPRIFGLYSVGCPIWETVAPPCPAFASSYHYCWWSWSWSWWLENEFWYLTNGACLLSNFQSPPLQVTLTKTLSCILYLSLHFIGLLEVFLLLWIHKGWNLENSSSMNLVNRLNAL